MAKTKKEFLQKPRQAQSQGVGVGFRQKQCGEMLAFANRDLCESEKCALHVLSSFYLSG